MKASRQRRSNSQFLLAECSAGSIPVRPARMTAASLSTEMLPVRTTRRTGRGRRRKTCAIAILAGEELGKFVLAQGP
jgi:hypothetical protein